MAHVDSMESRDLREEIAQGEHLNEKLISGESCEGTNCCNSANLDALHEKISLMENRLRIVEQERAIQKKSSLDPTTFIRKETMVEMIRKAISQGSPTFGVSRSFIRKVLTDENHLTMSGYYSKKMNNVLQSGVDSGVLLYDSAHQLYKLA